MDGQYCGEPEHHRQTYLDRTKHADLPGHLDQVPSILILTQCPALPCLTIHVVSMEQCPSGIAWDALKSTFYILLLCM